MKLNLATMSNIHSSEFNWGLGTKISANTVTKTKDLIASETFEIVVVICTPEYSSAPRYV